MTATAANPQLESRAEAHDGSYGVPWALTAEHLAWHKAAYLATELQGGYGFIQETAATRHYQDARILTIGEGTSEVQRMLIARGLGLPV